MRKIVCEHSAARACHCPPQEGAHSLALGVLSSSRPSGSSPTTVPRICEVRNHAVAWIVDHAEAPRTGRAPGWGRGSGKLAEGTDEATDDGLRRGKAPAWNGCGTPPAGQRAE